MAVARKTIRLSLWAMNKKIWPMFAGMLIICTSAYAQIGSVPAKYLWLGEPRPGATPQLFAPGIVSDAMSNRDMAISPKGDELFYTIQAAYGQVSTVLYMHYSPGSRGAGAPDGPIEAGWSGPEIAPFSGVYGDLEPVFSIGGDTLFFVSNRPLRNGDPIKDYDIWMVKRDMANWYHWGEPIRMDTVINSEKDEFYPSIARIACPKRSIRQEGSSMPLLIRMSSSCCSPVMAGRTIWAAAICICRARMVRGNGCRPPTWIPRSIPTVSIFVLSSARIKNISSSRAEG
jgi:hypothetical protein